MTSINPDISSSTATGTATLNSGTTPGSAASVSQVPLLRLGTFELMERVDVPAKVTLNETVALAKKFGATDSYRYINGVLDQVGLKLRPDELVEG